jgi:mono/diheme cytochrome c family protein
MKTALLAASLSLAVTAAPVDFTRDVAPILAKRCQSCHGPAMQQSGLRLDLKSAAMKGGYSGAVIVAGDSRASRLMRMVRGLDKVKMPPVGAALGGAEIDTLASWIDAGAHWPAGAVTPVPAAQKSKPAPWSFRPVRKPPLPIAKANPIDAFIQQRLRAKAIKPAPEAPKATLIRRVHLDLTGLPPDPSAGPSSYEETVKTLLDSPHFGEKWARHWLDLARYADSEGGVQDFPRPSAWRYREWVIDALNKDMPFDRFTVEQIAGDLLPNAGLAQRIAAGFHRNTITSREGGVELERIRFEQLVDRVNTTGTVWLGLTIGCAQCHDHKYDPVTQRDYYRMLAFWENADERDIDAPLPGELGVYRQYAHVFRSERNKLIAEHAILPVVHEWEEGMRGAMANPGKSPLWDITYDAYSKLVDHGTEILVKKPSERTEREQDALIDFFIKRSQGSIGKERYEKLKVADLGKKLEKLDQQYPRLSQVMTLAESGRRHTTHLRIRGNYADRGIEVKPGLPEVLAVPSATDRLALARWIASRANPLTARVTVNRIWAELMGAGLVRTPDDFGANGEKPSHPELLDWLAAEFMDGGWSIKHLIRLIVTSETYKQSSNAREDLTSIDPDNRLFARQARFRLPAELIRDSALSAGGLLMDTIGGESVRPAQPDGVIDLQYSMKWEETSGRPRFRRGLYIHIQRTASYPLLMNFDSPDRTVSCARRETSNTPLQPLNLMNDPAFVEAAQALAARLIREESDPNRRAGRAFSLCFNRIPKPGERDIVLSHVERRRQLSKANPKAADSVPTGDLPGADPYEAAAWFGAARALLNSDEFITRE